MKVPGFTLIELLVALAIASVLSVGMMSSLTMVFKTNQLMDGIMDTSAGGVRLQQQLERDLSGVTIPTSLLVTATDAQAGSKGQPQKASDTKNEKTADTQSGDLRSGDSSSADAQKKNHLFFATQKENNTDLLTFFTTNPLTSFWSESDGQATSRLVRVVYRLEPDKENPPYFRLMRQEGMAFDFAQYTSGAKKSMQALEVAKGIKAFSMKFLEEDEPENKDQDKNAQQKKTVTYKTVSEWRGEDGKDTKEKKNPKVPRFVQLKVTLMDAKNMQEKTFEYVFPLPCTVEPFVQKKKDQQPGVPQSGGIRERIQMASNKPKTAPGGLLGQFTQNLGGTRPAGART